MRELLAPIAEGVVVVVYTIVAAALTGVGIVVEAAGLAALTTGDLQLGVWMAYMGALALYAGIVLLGAEHLLPMLVSRWRGSSGPSR